jgi:hypothetical protein
MHNTTGPNVIEDDCDASLANVFSFGAFADKNTGVMYHDMTGNFPFRSLDGYICYLIMYHYELNSILATPIDGTDDMTIFDAYKKNFEMLELSLLCRRCDTEERHECPIYTNNSRQVQVSPNIWVP